jgi:endoglucanase
MDRRQFLRSAGGAACGFAATGTLGFAQTDISASKLPRWRGFNLLEKFLSEHQARFVEKDFAWIADWGFDFVRLPLSYWCWSDPKDWRRLREPVLKEIDEAVEFGRQHKIHVCLNFHRAPGYCVNPPAEPKDLWSDEAALEACAFHWQHFAERYKGISNSRVSFNLLNEPAKLAESSYAQVVRKTPAGSLSPTVWSGAPGPCRV